MNRASQSPGGLGITPRTALWSWVVTLLTLLVFAAAILPQQKQTFQEHLESKAHGVAVSLRDVAAGAVVNEDFSSVVDHCKEMLNGDPALDYLVITKNDGFTLINERSGWRTLANASTEWRPAERAVRGGIGTVSLFGRRVFHYSQPFDYSGIQWGWIHVGLSLDSYDQSVTSLHRRTGVIAVCCVIFSLLASALYARRLVRPLLSLRATVQRIAAGDLTTRANVDRQDELGSLAASVNLMTDALYRRNRILETVRFAAQQFLSTADWHAVMPAVLRHLGDSAQVSRAYLFENRPGPDGRRLACQRYEWAAPGIAPQMPNELLQSFDYAEHDFAASAAAFERGEIVTGLVAQMTPAQRAVLEPQDIRSLIMVPIHEEGRWWGFLGLDDCAHERAWTDAERDSLRALADMLGAAMARQRAKQALIEANETLEQRVAARTRELQEQVVAREKAHAELAEAQQRLIEASRLAGKAEVATSVLHNVGNVLNSVSVSATLVGDNLRRSRVGNLTRAVTLLRSAGDDLATFLTQDARGRVLPAYLGNVAEHLAADRTTMLNEITSLAGHIEHIKKIVAMQQNFAKVAGAFEELAPAELVEDAIRLNTASFESHRIRIIREFTAPLPRINVDRHRVLQIIINLLSNARHALNAADIADKRIVVALRVEPGGRLIVQVRDNGVGISPENQTRIFQHGFTTKKNGHGFGLHSCANAAREIGGRLTGHSDGVNCGAEFTLELPLAPPATRQLSP